MSCARHTTAIVDHACGAELPADAAAHLESCAACRQLFEAQRQVMQALDAQLAQALEVQPSPRFEPAVLARVEREPIRRRALSWWMVPAATAAVLILAVAASWRSADRPAAERARAAVPSTTASAPVTPAPLVTSSSDPVREEPRPVPAPRRVDRPRVRAERPSPVHASVIVPAAHRQQAVARYLALVRAGTLDTSSLIDGPPTDLVIAPLAVEGLVKTDVDNETGPGTGRGPGSR